MKHGLHFPSWVVNLSLAGKLHLITAIMATIIAVQLAALWNGLLILSTLRAYVGGEGLWSKAQKEAVLYLHHYAESRNESDYRKFLASLAVPKGDETARLELDKAKPDFPRVYRGFIEGRNDPADVKSAATFYRRYRRTRYLKQAIAIWREGDARIARLENLGSRLHALAVSGRSGSREGRAVLRQVDALNDSLTILEDNFSYTLGEASRWAYKVLLFASLAVAALLGSLGVAVSIGIGRLISGEIGEIKAGAQRIAEGKYDVTLPARSGDEIGLLARSFNAMARSLSKSRTDLEAVIHAIPDMMLRLSPDGTLLDVKPAKGFSFPFLTEEASGKKIGEVLPGEKAERFGRRLAKALVTGDLQSFEFSAAAGALERRYEARMARALDDEVVVVVRDVTEARKLDEMKTSFVAFAAHQLKTPEAEMAGCIDNMLSGYAGNLTEKQTRYLQYMREIVIRNGRLISNLLNASSIEEGTISFGKHTVDIGTIVADAVSQYLPIIRRKGLWIDFARPANPLMALADPQKGIEIVKTVLDNAVKFTASGGIEIVTHVDDHFVYVAVNDTGPGIPLDIQAKLFTRELAFTGPHPERGFGLGLFIAKKLMEIQQGAISVDSSPGRGSRVVLKFQRSERNPARLEEGESARIGEPVAAATARTAIQEGDETHG